MNIQNLKQQAAARLDDHAHRLTLIHSAIAGGVSLLIAAIGYILSVQANTTGGLAGIGSRSMLLTAQTVLSYCFVLLLPFWNLGYIYTSLGFARQKSTTIGSLAEGFRRFQPALRMMILRTALILGICYLCLMASSILYMLSPWSEQLFLSMEQIPMDAATIDMATVESLMPMLIPVYVLFGVLLCVFLVPYLYRLRLTDFLIVDTATGARDAFRRSAKAMKGNRFAFFKLDISFWWYFLLLGVANTVAWGDSLLSLMGIQTGAVGYFACCILSTALQVLITWRFAPLVYTTQALAYQQLTTANEELRIDN